MNSEVKAIRNPWNRNCVLCESSMNDWKSTHIGDDGELGEHVEDSEPDADVLRPLRHCPPRLANKFLRVQPDLDPVILKRCISV